MPYFQRVYDSVHYQNGSELEKQRVRHIRQNLSRAAARPHPQEITITLDEVYKIGVNQGWKDPFSGDDLEFVRGGNYFKTNVNGTGACNPMSCSIDRINPKKGYVKGNVVLVTTVTNMSKGNLSDKAYKEQCMKVAKNCQ